MNEADMLSSKESVMHPQHRFGDNVGQDGPFKILLVEDESIVALDLSDELQNMGYIVCGIADNAASAIALADEHMPDLVLMDIIIKGEMDGIDAATNIVRRHAIPIIFLTAYSDNETVARASKVGSYGYVNKPYKPRELRAVIEIAMQKAKLERNLRESEYWFSTTLRCVADGVVATDIEGNIRFMNPRAEEMLGISLETAAGKTVESVMHVVDSKSHHSVAPTLRNALQENRVIGVQYGRSIINTEGDIPVDESAAPIRDDYGNVIGAIVAFRDVRERIESEQALKLSEERFRMAFSFAPVGMALVGMDGTFMQVNDALCRLLDYSEDQLLHISQYDLTKHEDIATEEACLKQLLSGEQQSVQFEKQFNTRDKVGKYVLTSVSLLTQHDLPFCYLYQIHDLSQRKEAEHKLEVLAHYDVLTGLLSRGRFLDEIEHQIVAMRAKQMKFALIFIDLDHFKEVNDTLGHDAGDELLQIVATKLKLAVRNTDYVGRLGGDEFVILLPSISNIEHVLSVSNKIWSQFSAPVMLQGQEVKIGMSMGASVFPDDGEDTKALLKSADSALYFAKAEGRNNMQFYRPELTNNLNKKLKLENELRHALERNELELYYQPIINLSTMQLCDAEALIRWNHPVLGLVGPDDFIPVAEETGLINQIGDWVIQQACIECSSWPLVGNQRVGVAVNLSAKQFKSGSIVETVKQALRMNDLPSYALTLEITEQLLLNDTEQNLRIISEFKALGVKIAIDDFGIGYSSLSYIKRFGPNKIKIDRSFIRDITFDVEDKAIVKAINAMAKSLNMMVIAEGVESEVLQAYLLSEQVEFAQGFFYSKPVNASNFRLLMASPDFKLTISVDQGR